MNSRRKVIIFIKEKILAILCITLIFCLNIISYGNAEQENIYDNPDMGMDVIEGDNGISVAKLEEMDKLDWEKDVSDSIGSITLSNNGKEVKMEGNPSLPGKNAIYIIPSNHQEQTLQFTYNVDYGDSFIASGVLLNVKKEGNQLKGYMLSFNYSSARDAQNFYDEAGGKLRSVMDIYI